MVQIDYDTPIAMLTVRQLLQLIDDKKEPKEPQKEDNSKHYVYGLSGLAKLLNCSIVTAHKIKKSGKIDAAVKQIGRKIIVDADLVIELIRKKHHKC